jgi:hypothetical protein
MTSLSAHVQVLKHTRHRQASLVYIQHTTDASSIRHQGIKGDTLTLQLLKETAHEPEPLEVWHHWQLPVLVMHVEHD